MHILVSNDDGVYAPGLAALAAEMARFASVDVVAPDQNRSASSQSLTLDRPLETRTHDNGFISINGTPTDCVHLGVSGLFTDKPDIVVSGVNAGANLGDDVLYSGTVAAALEGRHLEYPSVAVSLVGHVYFETAAVIAAELVERIAELDIPSRTVLNVNVPDLPLAEIKGIHVTRLGHRFYSGNPVKMTDPRGIDRYWISAAAEAEDDGPGTDFFAVAQGYVSVTPIQADMTRHAGLDNVGEWLEANLD